MPLNILSNYLNQVEQAIIQCQNVEVELYQEEGYAILELDLLNPKVKCKYCGFKTDNIHNLSNCL